MRDYLMDYKSIYSITFGLQIQMDGDGATYKMVSYIFVSYHFVS